MKIERIYSDKAPVPIGPYSQGMCAGGFVFTAGQIGLGENGTIVEGGAGAQTRVALGNVRAVLEAGGSSLDRVLKTTIFLKNMEDFVEVNAAYGEIMGAHAPARSTVEVARLPKDALVEIEAIAFKE
jgi:2-iminobutanoate/2-iminopropanoate deaminase